MKFYKLKGDVFMSLSCDSRRVHCQECIYGISEITSERVLPGWFQNPSIFRDGNKMTIIILFMSHHQRRRLQTDVRPIISFCDHWKHQKMRGFFILLGGIEKNGLTSINLLKVAIIKKLVNWFAGQINWLVSIRWQFDKFNELMLSVSLTKQFVIHKTHCYFSF